MGKKVNLPLLEKDRQPPAKKPSIDTARRRLGGRMDAGPPPAGIAPGLAVTFALPTGGRRAAVVVYAGDDEVHVLLDPMRLRRLQADELELHDGALDDELAKLAADAHVFGMLIEGQDIRYADESGGLVDGKLVEKCRWGALIARHDGAVVAVGFRKLWPVPGAGPARGGDA